MKRALYRLFQWTWGLPQTLAGLVLYLYYYKNHPHFSYHGAVVTRWNRRDGVSLGMFLFVPRKDDPWFRVHEYGHTVQSLILGPFYLLLVGIPSLLWSRLPHLRRKWIRGQRAYDSVYPENWATRLGVRVTGEQL